MNTWVAWFAISVSAVLLAGVGVLLFRIMIHSRTHRRRITPAKRHFVPTTPDETMVISRQQADEMLKSRYNLEFLGIRREVKERELEDRLIDFIFDEFGRDTPHLDKPLVVRENLGIFVHYQDSVD